MRLTILGSSGSVPAPGNPASGYLVSTEGAPPVVMDMGSGVLAALQEIHNPTEAHVIFSHLHSDHCADFPSLMVWRRFHPTDSAKGRNLCLGPSDTAVHLGRLSSDIPDEVNDMSDTFAFSPWVDRQPEIIDRFTVTPFRVVHPIETFALRIEEHTTGKTLTYSGDSGYTDVLIDAARDCDVFLCEATWGDSCEGKVPGMHICGHDAGIIAAAANVKRLIITHVPPWSDPEKARAAAAEHYDGPIELSRKGLEFEI